MSAPTDDDPIFPYADLTKTNEHFSDGIRQRVDDTGFLLERVNPNNVWEPFTISNAIINPSTGQPYPRFGPYVDLGVIRASEVASLTSKLLIPYQAGRLIRKVFFSLDGLVAFDPSLPFTGYIQTPNTSQINGSQGNGYAIFQETPTIVDTDGLFAATIATGISPAGGLAIGKVNQILDTTPLIISNLVGVAPFLEPIQSWQHKQWAFGETIIDSNGFLQVVSTNGTSGNTPPVWNDTLSGTTNDGTVVWQASVNPSVLTGAARIWAEVIDSPGAFVPYPASVEFVQQPTNITSGNAFSPNVSVRVIDQIGNPFVLQSLQVELDIIGDGTYSDTANTDVTGLATFSGTLTASASLGRRIMARIPYIIPYFHLNSNPFNVT